MDGTGSHADMRMIPFGRYRREIDATGGMGAGAGAGVGATPATPFGFGAVPGLYQEYFGRDPLQWEIDAWSKNLGTTPGYTEDQAREAFAASPEHAKFKAAQDAAQQPPTIVQNRAQQMDPAYLTQMLGPAGSDWQAAARLQTGGMNNMPGVFFDYGNPNMASGQLGNPASSGNMLIQQILGGLPELFKPAADKSKDKGKAGNGNVRGILGDIIDGKRVE